MVTYCLLLLTSVTTAKQPILPDTDLNSMIGPINLCSTTVPHDATLIDMNPTDDCMINDPKQNTVNKIMVIPYFPRHFSKSFDIYSCSMETSIIETFFSFFGKKFINGRWTIYNPVSPIEYKHPVEQINKEQNKLFRKFILFFES